MILFTTARSRVRTMTESDAEAYFRIHGDDRIVQYIRKAKTREESDLFLKEHLRLNESLHPFGRWLAEDRLTGELFGTFVIIPVEGASGSFQLGYALLLEKWGQGLATELTLGGLAYLKKLDLLPEIYAYTDPANVASAAVLKKCGFLPLPDTVENGKTLHRFLYRLKPENAQS